MKLRLALGVAAAAWAAASIASPQTRVVVAHGGAAGGLDADADGWVSRAEASAGFDRLFDQMDGNDDGALTQADHQGRHGAHAPHAPHAMVLDGEDENCERTESNENGQRRVTVICGDGEGEDAEDDEEGEHRSERRVVIVRGGDGEAPSAEEIERVTRHAQRQARHAERHGRRAEREVRRHGEEAEHHARRHVEIVTGEGAAMALAHAPMMLMMLGGRGEADLNNDGALSRDEFRTQHLRFFDASDANGDGRVRLDLPEPPAPPAPPAAPPPRN